MSDRLTRIAIVNNDKKCRQECKKSCPVVRTGKLCIEVTPESKIAFISERLCIGCGICPKKCPFGAINIINLPTNLETQITHRYSANSFKLHRLPMPRPGHVLGLVGTNGIGKSTALKILSGKLKPNQNLGRYDDPPDWEEILKYYRGSELQNYFTKVLEDDLKAVVKPQYVDQLPKAVRGPDRTVQGLLKGRLQKENYEEILEVLELKHILERDIDKLSGGELQRFAVATVCVQQADVYMFDEPSSYLDVKQRLNLRFREESLTFRIAEAGDDFSDDKASFGYSYPKMEKTLGGFHLTVEAGEFTDSEIIVMMGENGTGKTTFCRMLAGAEKPDGTGKVPSMNISMKPQKITPKFTGTVRQLFFKKIKASFLNPQFQTDVYKPLKLDDFVDQEVQNLSGGELQRVAIVLALGIPADIYLIDEPSAYLDSEQRIVVARVIKRFIMHAKKTAFIVEHDFLMATYLSDRVIVFDGKPSINARANKPESLLTGCNKFLKNLDVTFRRDPGNFRPRINKHDSQLDQEQKLSGNYVSLNARDSNVSGVMRVASPGTITSAVECGPGFLEDDSGIDEEEGDDENYDKIVDNHSCHKAVFTLLNQTRVSTAANSGNTIKVVARFRPPNKAELASGGETIVDFDTEETCTIKSSDAAGAFTFDRVFDTSSRQTDVFEFSIRSTVDDILNGYNGTVFAYGQTGAGKSYTMMGADIDDEEQRGIIPRIVEQMFASILRSPGNIEYTVRVSYMEIYMEKIRDLLVPQNDNLPIHEEKSRGVYVKGLLEIYVSSVHEVLEVMRRGGAARATAATNMNQESSRSHSIFVITITQKNVETGSAKSGQLFLVDLAGSEKVGKTGASGQTLEEAKKINKSLSALGMVINSLTDGRSTHIPYRDSKLTRILQESLGGNSRTTLIINCSPSSYNDQETISTLRFGVRAKAIKNKAKINAELSPLELKQLLKKAQNQVTTYETYVASLEGEVQAWRGGETVPKEKWAPPLPAGGVAGSRVDSTAPRPGTPSRLQEVGRSETPSRSESRIGDRSSTPSIVLEKDEREEFLRRENELQDQVSEKESALSTAERELKEAREELQLIKENGMRTGKANERLNSEVNELRMHLERVAFESKEASITMDGLKEANTELTTELDDVKQQLLDVRMNAKETHAVLDEKEKKKAERMAQMMAGFDMGGDVFSDNESKIRRCIEQVEVLHSRSAAGELVAPGELDNLKIKLAEVQRVVRQADVSLNATADLDDSGRRKGGIEEKVAAVEQEYEELLERNLSEADVEEVKARLSDLYTSRRETQIQLIRDMREELERKDVENNRLRAIVEDSQRNAKMTNGHASPAIASKTVQQQIADFDVMKKSLMRDLQNRCERVVELEISLDETREQYSSVLRSSNNRAQQKKMAFLERNLEQLTQVQRQLVEQNGSLKKEAAIAERKLVARNERIMSLEALLSDSQEKLTAANHRFEGQLAAVKERLEAAKFGSTRDLSSNSTTTPGFSFGGAGSRIAKPLRGGGTTEQVNGGGPNVPALSGLQAQEANGSPGAKRGSWFFSDRR
ncbi:MAG: hypothetical protein Q9217_003993 [Psora testacea]